MLGTMWILLRDFTQPWQTIPGWEFDLLRALPLETASRLYYRTLRLARPRLVMTWRWRLFHSLATLLSLVSFISIWFIAKNQGLGLLGRMAIDLGFHAALLVIAIRHYVRLTALSIRSELAEELLAFSNREIDSSRRNPKRKTIPLAIQVVESSVLPDRDATVGCERSH